MDQKRQLRDYQELLDFAKEELLEDQKKLKEIRDTNPDPKKVEAIEEEIEVLKRGIDRYQRNIKTLKRAIDESENQ